MAGQELANLFVRIGADMQGFNKALGRVKRDLQSLGQDLQNAGATMTAAITAPLLAIGGAATRMAMEAVESENLFEVSMGNMADAAREWSEELQESLGLNAYEVRKSVGTFNAMFTAMGLGEQAAYDMATGLTQLAYDMASFFNLNPEEAFEKLRSGISGETEPLKQLGVVVNETTIKLWALENGLIQQGQTMTEQQKIIARYNVIMEQTKLAQGDLARTLDSPTNKIRTMGSQVKNLSIDLGMALLPAISDLLDAVKPMLESLKSAIQRFRDLDEETRRATITKLAFAAAVGPVMMAIGAILNGVGHLIGAFRIAIATMTTFTAKTLPNLVKVMTGATAATGTFAKAIALMTSPITWVVGGLALLVGGIVAYNRAQARAREEEYQRSKSLLELTRRHDELRAIINDGAKSEEERAQASKELERVMEEIGEKFPELIAQWDKHGKAVALDTKLTQENTRAAEENIKAKARAGIQNLQNQMAMLTSRREWLEQEIAKLEAQGKTQRELTEQEEINALFSGSGDPKDLAGETIGELRAQLRDVLKEISQAEAEMAEHFGDLYGNIIYEGYDPWKVYASGATQGAKASQETTQQVGKLASALDIVRHRLRQLDAEWDIYTTQAGDAAESADGLARKKGYLEDRLQLLRDQVAILTAEYERSRAELGQYDESTLQLAEALTDARKEIASVESALIDLSPEVINAQRNLDAATTAVQGMEQWVAILEGQLQNATRALSETERAIEDLEAASKEAEQGISDALGVMANHVRDLESEISRVKGAMRDLANVRLAGEGELEDRLWELEQQEARIRLAINEMKLAGVGADDPALRELEEQLREIGLLRERVQLERTLEIEPLRRELQRLTDDTRELSFEEARNQILKYRDQLVELNRQHADWTTQLIELQETVEPLVPSLTETTMSFDEAKAKVLEYREALEQNRLKLAELTAKQTEQQVVVDALTAKLNTYQSQLETLTSKQKEAATALQYLRDAAREAAAGMRSRASDADLTPEERRQQAGNRLDVLDTVMEMARAGNVHEAARLLANSWGLTLQQALQRVQEALGNVPQMAAGGIVTRPTFAMVGEAGPEAIVPLGRLSDMLVQALRNAVPQQQNRTQRVVIQVGDRTFAEYLVDLLTGELRQPSRAMGRA